MKRKLLSFVIAFALLSQTMVSAGDLYNTVTTDSQYSTCLDTNSRFSYTIFDGKVPCTVTSRVKPTGSLFSAYSASLTGYPNFDYIVDIDMTNVKTAFNTLYNSVGLSLSFRYPATATTLKTKFDNSKVVGTFDVNVEYESGITPPASPSLTLKTNRTNNFADSAPSIYALGVHTSTPVDASHTKITVPVTVNTTVYDLYSNPDYLTALDDLAVEVTGWSVSGTEKTLVASMEGNTVIVENESGASDNEEYAIIEYKSPSELEDSAAFNKSIAKVSYTLGGHGGGSRNNSNNNNDVDVVIDSKNNSNNSEVAVTEDDSTGNLEITNSGSSSHHIVIESKPDEKQGFVENGYSLTPYAGGDKDYDGTTIIDVQPGQTVSLYPRYVNVTVPEALQQETDENGNFLHKVYIYGYPDGEVKPNGDITREEVTAAFDRLLNTIYRATIATTEQDFPDVNNDRWSNESIATMANGGFIVGDENGNFNPSKPITRAEFAVIAAKFAPVDAEISENYFTDIDGHWAKDFILKIAGQYWISGNPDGTFNPDAPITRAEAMTIINRMLVRYGDHESDYATQWPDVDRSDWYYDSVIEATTHNTYVRTENGWSEAWIGDEEIE